jgi:hypothetical protein
MIMIDCLYVSNKRANADVGRSLHPSSTTGSTSQLSAPIVGRIREAK